MKRRSGKRAFAAFMAAAMILSASTELVSAKASGADQSAATEVSDASSSVASTEQMQSVASIVAEGSALSAAKTPTGLKGKGTETDPYQIASVNDLLLMNAYINYERSSDKNFVLTADIDLSTLRFPATESQDFAKKSSFRDNEGIYAVVSAKPSLSGNSNVSFRLNGNGFSFTNMNVTVPEDVQAAGLFGYVSANSVIENVAFTNCKLRVGGNTTGAYAVIAVQNHGTIRNITVSDCIADFRSAKLRDDGKTFVSLECGKVYKGIALVTADNNGTITGAALRSSDKDHGVFVRDAVQYVGAIAGQNRKDISDCTVRGVRLLAFGSRAASGMLSGDGSVAKYVGMIAGGNNSYISRKPASISGCSVSLVYGSDLIYGDYVGGIVGLNAGTVSACSVKGSHPLQDAAPAFASADMTGAGHYGGLVGLNNGTVTQSGAYDLTFAFSDPSSANVYGGLVSENCGNVSYCVASGYVHTGSSSAAAVGGLVGCAANGSSLSDTYSFVAVSAPTSCCGAVAASNADAAYADNRNYWIPGAYGFDSAVAATETTVNQIEGVLPVLNIPAGTDGVSFSGSSMTYSWPGSKAVVSVDYSKTVSVDNGSIHVSRAASSFSLSSKAGGASGHVTFYANVKLPEQCGTERSMLVRISAPVFVTDIAAKGAGQSASNPIMISTYEQFKYIQASPDAHYRLVEDITIGSDWVPIDFSGTLDGGGHTIRLSGSLFTAVVGSRNFDINDPNWANSAGNVKAGFVSNVTIEATGAVYGSVFGEIRDATLERITYRADDNGFAVLSAARAGALVDTVSGNAYLHNCYVSVPVTVVSAKSEGIGALVGRVDAQAFVMDNCGTSSTLAVDGHALARVGGLVGYVSSVFRGRIICCYASGSVYTKPESGNADARIAVGVVSGGARRNLTVSECYYSIPVDAIEGCSVAFEAIDSDVNGFTSLAKYEDTYKVDPNGDKAAKISFQLPKSLDACQDVQTEDITIDVENEKSFAVTSTDVTNGEVNIEVTVQDDAKRGSDSDVTIVHEPTGLQLVNTVIQDVGIDEYNGYYEIYSIDDLEAIADNWANMRGEKFKLCADIEIGTSNANGTLDSFPATSSMPFTGQFIGGDTSDPDYDGNDTDNDGIFSIKYANLTGQALFPYVRGATFRDFALDHIVVNSSAVGVGILVGIADYDNTSFVSTFSNITISNCSVTSTASKSNPGSNPVNITASNTVQVGTLAGSLGSKKTSAQYNITGITVSDTTVTNTQNYAYGVGGLIGLAYCLKPNSGVLRTQIGSTTDITRTFGSGASAVQLSGSVIMYNVQVTGYGSVGGVLGMAGQFPQDADSANEFTYEYLTNAGDLKILHATVYGSTVTAGNSVSKKGGTCGGILGSEVVGEYENDSANCAITGCNVMQSTITTYAGISSQTNCDSACGGIAGYCGGTISGCTVSDTEVHSVTAGGIAGRPSRKDYYYKSANQLNVTDCVVKGESLITSTSDNAMSLGGIVASSVNTSVVIQRCKVGENVEVSGNAKHVGGFVGYVYSNDTVLSEEYGDAYYSYNSTNLSSYQEAHEFTVQNSFCAGTLANTASGISASSVGGASGYAEIDEKRLTVSGTVFSGEYSNPYTGKYCAGVVGHFVSTKSGGYNGTALPQNKQNFIAGCTIACILNPSLPAASDTTCKFVSKFECGTWITGSRLANAIKNNYISNYMQQCRKFGLMSNNALLEEQQDNYVSSTHYDIDKPDGYYSNDTNESDANNPIQTITGSDPDTVALTNMTPYASTGTSNTFRYSISSGNWRNYWSSADDDYLTVDAVSSGPSVTVTGVSNGNAAIVCALDIMSATLPDSGEYAKILIHVPLIVEGIDNSVDWNTTVLDSKVYYLIDEYAKLDALHNSSADLSANYLVIANIDISNDTNNFSPIAGDSSSQFTGEFRCQSNGVGSYYKITGLNYSGNATSAGLFGYSNGARFVDVNLEIGVVSATGTDSATGALVGTANSTTFTNVKIAPKSGVSNPQVYGNKYAGGLAAKATDCVVNGVDVSGFAVNHAQYCGGLFGRACLSATSGVTNSITSAVVSGMSVSSYSASGNTDVSAGIAAQFSGTITSPVSVASATISTTSGASSGAIGEVVGSIVGVGTFSTSIAGITVASTTTVSTTNLNASSAASGIVLTHSAGTLSISSCRTDASISSYGSTGGIVAVSTYLAGLTVDHAIVSGTLTGLADSGNNNIGGLVANASGTFAAGSFTNTVFSASLVCHDAAHEDDEHPCHKGAAFGLCTSPSSNVLPVTNFYYSSFQNNNAEQNLVGHIPEVVFGVTEYQDADNDDFSASLFDMQGVLSYNGSDTISCSGTQNLTLDPSLFTFADITVASGGTYKNFSAASSVPFVLSSVTPSIPSGLFNAFNIESNTFTGLGTNVGQALFHYANGIVIALGLEVSSLEGAGTAADPYLIFHTSDLRYLMEPGKSTAYFAIVADLMLNDYDGDGTTDTDFYSQIWSQSAWQNLGFTGILYGSWYDYNEAYNTESHLWDTSKTKHDYTISNLVLSDSSHTSVGFFPVFKGTMIGGIFENCSVTATAANADAGIVVGRLNASYDSTNQLWSYGTINGVTVRPGSAAGNVSTVSGVRHVGGIAGVSFGNILNCTVQNTTVTGNLNNAKPHAAGGIMGGGVRASDCEVSGCSVQAIQFAGGIIGCAFANIEFPGDDSGVTGPYLTGVSRTQVLQYLNKGNAQLTGCEVSGTSIAAHPNSTVSQTLIGTSACAGGIIGYVGPWLNTAYRYITISNCKVDTLATAQSTTILADRISGTNTGSNYAGGVIGYLDQLNSCNITGCEVFGAVTAHGDGTVNNNVVVNETSVGGLVGAMRLQHEYRFYEQIDGTVYRFALNSNVVGGSLTSPSYAGGLMGRFVGFYQATTSYLVPSTADFISYNLISSKFNVEPSGDELNPNNADHFGVMLGLFIPNEQVQGNTYDYVSVNMILDTSQGATWSTAVKSNYYTSYVCGSDITVYGSGSMFSATAYNVAESFKVKNPGASEYTAAISSNADENDPAPGTYNLPLQIQFTTPSGTADLSAQGSSITVGSGSLARTLQAADFGVPNGSLYSANYTISYISGGVSVSGAQHHGVQYTLISQPTRNSYLEASLGYGLKIGLPIESSNGDGSYSNPYRIDSAGAFVEYFFTQPDNQIDYMSSYYRQTVDLKFGPASDSTSILGVLGNTSFAPIGTEADPFVGGYDGYSHKITGFFYSNSQQVAAGLFGHVSDPDEDDLSDSQYRLRNVHIELDETSGVTGGKYTGGLVGHYSSIHTIRNCSVVYGTVTAVRDDTASNTYSATDPETKWNDYAFAGGLVGYMLDAKLDGCFTSTAVHCGDSVQYNTGVGSPHMRFTAGGLVGYSRAAFLSETLSFNRCFCSSDVVGAYAVGSFIGRTLSPLAVKIENAVSTATVTATFQQYSWTGNYSAENVPPSLVTGVEMSYQGSSTSPNYSNSALPIVTARNLVVAGINATQYNKYDTSNHNVRNATLFGTAPATSSSVNVYYDAQVTGRLSIPYPDGGDSFNCYYLEVDGDLYNQDETLIAASSLVNDETVNVFLPKGKTTVELLHLGTDAFNVTGVAGFDTNAWLSGNQNTSLYPVLDMYDTYSLAFAKLSSLPIYADPREANDIDSNDPNGTGKRIYRGMTYPMAIDDKLLNSPIEISASANAASGDGSTSYDALLYGGFTYSSDYVGNSSKAFDLLFKHPASQYIVIRNSYLDASANVSTITRNEMTPSVTLSTTLNSVPMKRVVRIPLRGESETVYVSTERQLRAIMGTQTTNQTEFTTRFVNAYRKVVNGNCTNVKICADIDLDSDTNFVPIAGYDYNVGNNANETKFGFDGSNCVISGMKISKNSENAGMFASLRSGSESKNVKLQNIILNNIEVTGTNYVGALVGRVGKESSSSYGELYIVNCKVIGESSVTGGNYVGGMVGWAAGTSFNYNSVSGNNITNAVCGSGADVNGSGGSVGGLVGEMYKVVRMYNCYATGDVTLEASKDNENNYVPLTAGSVGGFVGKVTNEASSANYNSISHAFAFGNVEVKVGKIGNQSTTNFGVGGFAGVAQIALSDCFASGDVLCSLSSYDGLSTTTHGIGGLVGISSASVQNAYSSSAVSLSCSTSASLAYPTIGVGGVVGYSTGSVQSVYSSGSVSVPSGFGGTDENDNPLPHYVGGAAGYVSGEAKSAIYDTWTNAFGTSLSAVGNKTDDAASPNFRYGYSTDEFCSGSVVGNNKPLSAGTWGYDSVSATSNAYPYLTSFFTGDVSSYVKFPAVLSVVAVRPNDRDESGRAGHGYSMAVTRPETVYVQGVTYNLGWTEGTSYGSTYVPSRKSNGSDDVAMKVWVNSYKADNESLVHTGFYDLAVYDENDSDILQVVSGSSAGDGEVTYDDVKALARDDFVPHVGQYVKLSEGYKAYGERTIRRKFQMMLGTDKYPFLISTPEELRHIFFTPGGTLRTPTNENPLRYYELWYSQINPDNGVYTNVSSVTNLEYAYVPDSVVHYRLMINIDMTGQSFTPIGSRTGTYNGITFQGYELDGNDYAIVNFTSANGSFIDTLDEKSTVKNLVFDNATISGSGAKVALIATNNGTVDGLMLTQHVDSEHPNVDTTQITASSAADTAGIAAENNGTIRNCIVQGSITGGGTVSNVGKYVGGIAAVNNGTIDTCVSAASLSTLASTAGVGGLVGKNDSFKYKQSNRTDTLEVVASNTATVGENQIRLSDVTPVASGDDTPAVDDHVLAAGFITDSFTLGNVTGTSDVLTGGFVGENAGKVSNSYSRASVSGDYEKAGSYVGDNTATGSIDRSFSAGKLALDTYTGISGSAFAGNNDGTLNLAYADKALLGKDTAMLIADAEVTENIRDASCFGGTGNVFILSGESVTVPSGRYKLSGSGVTGALKVVSDNPGTGEIGLSSVTPCYPGFTPRVGQYVIQTSANDSLENTTTSAYPQIKKVYQLFMRETTSYQFGTATHVYTTLKAQFLYAYSNLASVTVDTVAANYVDSIPVSTTNPVSTITRTGYSVTPTTAISSNSSTSGSVVATSAQLSQKIGAGENVADDLKYTLTYRFNYVVTDDENPNPNFDGTGTDESKYEISNKEDLQGLAYFSGATDAYFKVMCDVNCGGTALDVPIKEFNATLDGQNHTINDLVISDNGGLFGKLGDDAVIKNLGLVGIDLSTDPTTEMLNFGLLAGEAGQATVQDVYAIGTISIDNVVSVTNPVNVGGLIGKAVGTTITRVVTSGKICNNHVANGSTVGGVIGLMNSTTQTVNEETQTISCALSKAESTAYVCGALPSNTNHVVYVGGIVGKADGSSSISGVIYAGQVEGTSAATVDLNTTSDNNTGGAVANRIIVSHILASQGANATVSDARYDYTLATFAEGGYTRCSTWQLAQYSSSGIFNASVDRSKYYPSPIAYATDNENHDFAAFNAGLMFALARITASIAGSPAKVNDKYDTLKISSPLTYVMRVDNADVTVGNSSDTVALSVDPNRTAYYDGVGTGVLEPNQDGTGLTTSVTATLNNASGSSFAGMSNSVIRYLYAKVPRVVTVSFDVAVTQDADDSGFSGKLDLTIKPDPTNASSVSSNAITDSDESADSASVQFSRVVMEGSTIDVNTILPTGYTYAVTSATGGATVGSDQHSVSLASGQTAVTITVTVDKDTATWGLQNLNGTVTSWS